MYKLKVLNEIAHATKVVKNPLEFWEWFWCFTLVQVPVTFFLRFASFVFRFIGSIVLILLFPLFYVTPWDLQVLIPGMSRFCSKTAIGMNSMQAA